MVRLLLSLIERARLDLRSKNVSLREAAARWVDDPLGSFPWVCEQIGFDPSEARKSLLAEYRVDG